MFSPQLLSKCICRRLIGSLNSAWDLCWASRVSILGKPLEVNTVREIVALGYLVARHKREGTRVTDPLLKIWENWCQRQTLLYLNLYLKFLSFSLKGHQGTQLTVYSTETYPMRSIMPVFASSQHHHLPDNWNRLCLFWLQFKMEGGDTMWLVLIKKRWLTSKSKHVCLCFPIFQEKLY